MFTEDELEWLGKAVNGLYHYEEGSFLIFGSNTWPSYRISVIKDVARLNIDMWMHSVDYQI